MLCKASHKGDIINMNNYLRKTIYGSILVMLSGCAVGLKPISNKQHLARAGTDYHNIYKDIKPLDKPLTLEDAVFRGLKYNLDYRMTLMERTLQRKQLTLANFAMLPNIAASAGYDMRDKERASQSISLLSRTESLEPSFSEEKSHSTADLTFSWNLLDFGLSYFQAKQQSDRVLVAVERRRKIMNTMSKEIINSYWKAVKAQNLLPRVTSLLSEVELALHRSERIELRKLKNPMSTLEFRRNLLQVTVQLKKLRTDLLMAKSQLAGLINLPSNKQYTLAAPNKEQDGLQIFSVNLNELQRYGLVFRPELREEGYQKRIDEQNVKKEILRLFPGLSLVASTNYDSNNLLYYNNWQQLGTRATWNLMSLIQGKSAISAAKTQVEIADMRRLAQSAAILAQISISYTQYDQALEGYNTAEKLSNIEMKMLDQEKKKSRTNNGSLLDRVLKEAQAINSVLERDKQFIETKSAYNNLVTSVGLDIIPPGLDVEKEEKMAQIISKILKTNMLERVKADLKSIEESADENAKTKDKKKI